MVGKANVARAALAAMVAVAVVVATTTTTTAAPFLFVNAGRAFAGQNT